MEPGDLVFGRWDVLHPLHRLIDLRRRVENWSDIHDSRFHVEVAVDKKGEDRPVKIVDANITSDIVLFG